MGKPFKREGTSVWWHSFKDPATGKWKNATTGCTDEGEAARYATAFESQLAAQPARAPTGR